MNRCEGGECSRDGSGVIEIHGTNFGNNEKALVFANGLRCNETEQPSENLLLCSLEPSTSISTDSDTVVVVVGDQDTYFQQGEPLYATCSANTFQDTDDKGVYQCTWL